MKVLSSVVGSLAALLISFMPGVPPRISVVARTVPAVFAFTHLAGSVIKKKNEEELTNEIGSLCLELEKLSVEKQVLEIEFRELKAVRLGSGIRGELHYFFRNCFPTAVDRFDTRQRLRDYELRIGRIKSKQKNLQIKLDALWKEFFGVIRENPKSENNLEIIFWKEREQVLKVNREEIEKQLQELRAKALDFRGKSLWALSYPLQIQSSLLFSSEAREIRRDLMLSLEQITLDEAALQEEVKVFQQNVIQQGNWTLENEETESIRRQIELLEQKAQLGEQALKEFHTSILGFGDDILGKIFYCLEYVSPKLFDKKAREALGGIKLYLKEIDWQKSELELKLLTVLNERMLQRQPSFWEKARRFSRWL